MKARKELKSYESDNPIYLNEDLTRKRYQVARQARALKKDKKIDDTWTYDGKIFVKLNDGITRVVTTIGKLESLCPS